MTTMTAEMRGLKTRLKATWESGDYGAFATYLEKGALEFFDRLALEPGRRLLDVACGAGQLSLPAARQGIRVTGLDLAANLIQQAKRKSESEGLEIEFDEGDAEQLPYDDQSFDVVMSLIGSMFAPRPELVASEMARVCRAGGQLIMGNWTPTGHIGQMFKVIGKYAPPPAFVPSPLLWGDETTCRQRLGPLVSDLRFTRYMYPLEYPFPPAEVVDFFIEFYGPTTRAYHSLDATNQGALRDDLVALWRRNNVATDATTLALSEYAEVVGTRQS